MDKKLKIIDKYILKQIIETFVISLVIFTSIIFATDAFITIVKQKSFQFMRFVPVKADDYPAELFLLLINVRHRVRNAMFRFY